MINLRQWQGLKFARTIIKTYSRKDSINVQAELYNWSLTHLGRDKMVAISQTIFSNIFFNENFRISIEISFQVYFFRSNLQYSSIGSDSGLAPSRRKATDAYMLPRPQWVNGVKSSLVVWIVMHINALSFSLQITISVFFHWFIFYSVNHISYEYSIVTILNHPY